MSARHPARRKGGGIAAAPLSAGGMHMSVAGAALGAMLVASLAGPAGAQVTVQGRASQLFSPPEGCEIDVTVQLRQCQVANLYRCEAAPGDRFTTYADGEGIFYTSRIDDETRWITSISHVTGFITNLLEDSANHASFTALIETGEDLYDFRTEDSAGLIRRHIGVDRLTGERVVIDGVALEVTEFEATAEDGEGTFLYRRSGRQFIHRDWRVFFGGTDIFENAEGERLDSNDSPVSFAFPGEEGFATLEPLFDCNVLLTGLPSGVPDTGATPHAATYGREAALFAATHRAAGTGASLSSTRPAAAAGF